VDQELAGVANPLAFGGYVADLTREEMQRLARLGAKARLEELRQEESAIRSAFPDLFRGRGRKASAHDMGAPATRKRRRSNMSAAARKAVSERMKKYWAARRKEKK
jgi:hypothetical protein